MIKIKPVPSNAPIPIKSAEHSIIYGDKYAGSYSIEFGGEYEPVTVPTKNKYLEEDIVITNTEKNFQMYPTILYCTYTSMQELMRIRCSKDGNYTVVFTMACTYTDDYQKIAQLYVNGVAYGNLYYVDGNVPFRAASASIELKAGDIVSIRGKAVQTPYGISMFAVPSFYLKEK